MRRTVTGKDRERFSQLKELFSQECSKENKFRIEQILRDIDRLPPAAIDRLIYIGEDIKKRALKKQKYVRLLPLFFLFLPFLMLWMVSTGLLEDELKYMAYILIGVVTGLCAILRYLTGQDYKMLVKEHAEFYKQLQKYKESP